MISALFGLAGLAVGLAAVEAAQELRERGHLGVAIALGELRVDPGHVHVGGRAQLLVARLVRTAYVTRASVEQAALST